MSKFTGPLLISFSEDGRLATLLEDLVWEIGFKGSGNTITVPAGFISDGASVPRILWPLMPAWGDKGTRAAILHDYLLCLIVNLGRPEYFTARRAADRQFLEALLALGVAKWRAQACYLGVRAYARWMEWKSIYLGDVSV